MKEIQWIQQGYNYVADLEFGRVVISPNDSRDTPYTARIETKSGDIVAVASFDLVSCKEWAQVNLPLMDQIFNDLSVCGNVLETLEICQKHLVNNVNSSHWMRIEYIKKWIA